MSANQKTVDVIVIGAGLSGLRATVDIHKAGFSVLVLEARDRVGGKTLSVEASPNGGKGMVDLGAVWINDTNQSEMYALACQFQFDLVKQRTTDLTLHQCRTRYSLKPGLWIKYDDPAA